MPAHIVRVNAVVNISFCSPNSKCVNESDKIVDRRAKRNLFVRARSIFRFYGTTSTESPRKVIVLETRSLLCWFLSLLVACEFCNSRKETTTSKNCGKTFLHTFLQLSRLNSNHNWLGKLSNASVDQTVKFSSEHPADANVVITRTRSHSYSYT